MTIKSRLAKLEARKAQAEKPMKSNYTPAQWEASQALLREVILEKLDATINGEALHSYQPSPERDDIARRFDRIAAEQRRTK